MGIKSFKELEIWQKGIDLAKRIYQLTKEFPKEEQFGLVQQMRRSAISVPANIAEGWNRTNKEFYYFLNVSLGSLRELETYLILSKRIGFLSEEKIKLLLENIEVLSRQIVSLQKRLN